MTLPLFLDILILILLGLCLPFIIIVAYYFAKMRDSNRRLAGLLEQFYQVIHATQTDLSKLAETTAQAQRSVKLDLDRSAILRDEITFLAQKHGNAKRTEKPSSTPTTIASETSEEELKKLLKEIQ